jgi:hypothetical protein
LVTIPSPDDLKYAEDIALNLVFFRVTVFEDLRLRTIGTMDSESNGIRKLYEPSPWQARDSEGQPARIVTRHCVERQIANDA